MIDMVDAAYIAWLAVALGVLIAVFRLPRRNDKAEDIQCPVCGYYCLGRGGHGCIDKPSMQASREVQRED